MMTRPYALSVAVLSAISSASFADVPGLPPLPPSYTSLPVSVTPSRPDTTRQPLAGLNLRAKRLDFQFVSVGQLVSLIYGETLDTPFVIDPAVLADTRLISFRYNAKDGDLRGFLAFFLDSLGYQVERRAGVDFIAKVQPVDDDSRRPKVLVYRPRYRDANYLARLTQPLLRASFTVNRDVASSEPISPNPVPAPNSAAARIDQSGDTLVLQGEPEDIALLEELLPQLDTPAGEVMVRAVAYEVGALEESGSAFRLALELLGQRLGLDPDRDLRIPNTARLSVAGIDAIFALFAKDSRFRVVHAPNLRIRSGAEGKLTVGQKVPVLAAVTYPRGSGQPVQSIDYQSSGVIFTIRPQVRDDAIDLRVTQQISDFVKTQTGVNGSPTLNTREIATEISARDGDIIVMGGLSLDKDSRTRAGLPFLPRFLDSQSGSRTSSEILLVLEVRRIDEGAAPGAGISREARVRPAVKAASHPTGLALTAAPQPTLTHGARRPRDGATHAEPCALGAAGAPAEAVPVALSEEALRAPPDRSEARTDGARSAPRFISGTLNVHDAASAGTAVPGQFGGES